MTSLSDPARGLERSERAAAALVNAHELDAGMGAEFFEPKTARRRDEAVEGERRFAIPFIVAPDSKGQCLQIGGV
jgi:hypothetical protein